VTLPQLSTLVTDPPAGDAWLHEIKYDGYRLLCCKDGERVDCSYTRRGHRWSDKFYVIAESVSWLSADRAWQALATLDQACLAYYAFDLLYLDGGDLCRVALERRKEMLFEMIGEGEWNLRVIDRPVITLEKRMDYQDE
jgi:bifunctional non-homologous end joining protein LigD